MTTFVRSSVIAIALVATLLTSLVPNPALADGRASTRNIILAGAALLLTASAINNASHHRQSDQVVGYLEDGSTVYGDGRVVNGNGNTWYPSSRGLDISCDGNQRCSLVRGNNNGSYNGNYSGYNTGYNTGYSPGYYSNTDNDGRHYRRGYNNNNNDNRRRRDDDDNGHHSHPHGRPPV